MKERYQVSMTVGLLLIKEEKILLMKRQNTGYMDDNYGVVGGHVEEGESLKQAMVRETKEEVGINIKEEKLKYVCGIRRAENENYINFFFYTDQWEGTPEIKEPEKCSELKWVEVGRLPDNVIEAEKRAVYNYQNNIVWDEYHF